jgi:hypothetical protein
MPNIPSVFIQYSYLQLLDLLTTIAFLLHGVREGNPVVRLALEVAPTPLAGLAAVKAAALGLGLFCVWTARVRLLGRINAMFALIVAWNLFALIAGAIHHR